jgi:hypothetical protein
VFRGYQLHAESVSHIPKATAHHFGALRQETAQAKAQRIISEELGRRVWNQTDLATLNAQRSTLMIVP